MAKVVIKNNKYVLDEELNTKIGDLKSLDLPGTDNGKPASVTEAISGVANKISKNMMNVIEDITESYLKNTALIGVLPNDFNFNNFNIRTSIGNIKGLWGDLGILSKSGDSVIYNSSKDVSYESMPLLKLNTLLQQESAFTLQLDLLISKNSCISPITPILGFEGENGSKLFSLGFKDIASATVSTSKLKLVTKDLRNDAETVSDTGLTVDASMDIKLSVVVENGTIGVYVTCNGITSGEQKIEIGSTFKISDIRGLRLFGANGLVGGTHSIFFKDLLLVKEKLSFDDISKMKNINSYTNLMLESVKRITEDVNKEEAKAIEHFDILNKIVDYVSPVVLSVRAEDFDVDNKKFYNSINSNQVGSWTTTATQFTKENDYILVNNPKGKQDIKAMPYINVCELSTMYKSGFTVQLHMRINKATVFGSETSAYTPLFSLSSDTPYEFVRFGFQGLKDNDTLQLNVQLDANMDSNKNDFNTNLDTVKDGDLDIIASIVVESGKVGLYVSCNGKTSAVFERTFATSAVRDSSGSWVPEWITRIYLFGSNGFEDWLANYKFVSLTMYGKALSSEEISNSPKYIKNIKPWLSFLSNGDSIMSALPELKNLSNKADKSTIGELASLTTNNKENLVSAINEINEKASSPTGNFVTTDSEQTIAAKKTFETIITYGSALDPVSENDLVRKGYLDAQLANKADTTYSYSKAESDEKYAVKGDLTLISDKIGTLGNLTTTAKDNLVLAINELNESKLSIEDYEANGQQLTEQIQAVDAKAEKNKSDIATLKLEKADKSQLNDYTLKSLFDETVDTKVNPTFQWMTENKVKYDGYELRITTNTGNIAVNTEAIAELRELIKTVETGLTLIGQIEKSYEEVTADKDNLLNAFVQEKKQRAPKNGDIVWTNDFWVFVFVNKAWTNGARGTITYATTQTAGLVKLKDEFGYLVADPAGDGLVKVKGIETLALKGEGYTKEEVDAKFSTKLELSATDNKIGTLNNLTTTAKDNLVLAINEINAKASSTENFVTTNTVQTITAKKTFDTIISYGSALNPVSENDLVRKGYLDAQLANKVDATYAYSKGEADDKFATKANLTLTDNKIGTLGNLTTTAKDNLVNAINEVNSKPAQAPSNMVTTNTEQTVTARKIFSERAYFKNSPANENYGQFLIVDENTTNKRAYITFAKATADSVANLYGRLGIIGGDMLISVADKSKSVIIDTKAKYASDITISENTQFTHKKYVDTQLANKANTGDIYTKSQADSKFATKSSLTITDNKIGNLGNLTTSAKDNLVNAINEVSRKPAQAPSNMVTTDSPQVISGKKTFSRGLSNPYPAIDPSDVPNLDQIQDMLADISVGGGSDNGILVLIPYGQTPSTSNVPSGKIGIRIVPGS